MHYHLVICFYGTIFIHLASVWKWSCLIRNVEICIKCSVHLISQKIKILIKLSKTRSGVYILGKPICNQDSTKSDTTHKLKIQNISCHCTIKHLLANNATSISQKIKILIKLSKTRSGVYILGKPICNQDSTKSDTPHKLKIQNISCHCTITHVLANSATSVCIKRLLKAAKNKANRWIETCNALKTCQFQDKPKKLLKYISWHLKKKLNKQQETDLRKTRVLRYKVRYASRKWIKCFIHNYSIWIIIHKWIK